MPHLISSLKNRIILEGHGIKVPEYICDTSTRLAAKTAEEISISTNSSLPDRVLRSIQDHLDEESRSHISAGDLVPRKRIEG